MAIAARMMVMAGGTGGHIYPALAVANAWREEGGEIVWLGTAAGMESRLVPEAGFPVEWVQVSGLRGKGRLRWLMAPFLLLRALWQSARAIVRQQPDVILGMGGFVSGPGGVAAWLLRKPLLIHEQNSVAGLTNRLLSSIATEVLEAFPGTFSTSARVTTVGNPLRSGLMNLSAVKVHQPLRLLVLGGSLGAAAINQRLPAVAAKFAVAGQLEIWHQSGRDNLQQTLAGYRALGLSVEDTRGLRVSPYIEQMDEAYRWADLLLCRAGAMTISELAMAGRGAILVPFPYAVDDHQSVNGRFLQQAGAAELVRQSDLVEDQLEALIDRFINNPQYLEEMGAKAKELAQPDATDQVVRHCRRAVES